MVLKSQPNLPPNNKYSTARVHYNKLVFVQTLIILNHHYSNLGRINHHASGVDKSMGAHSTVMDDFPRSICDLLRFDLRVSIFILHK